MKKQTKSKKSSQKSDSAAAAVIAAPSARQTFSKQVRDRATNFQTVDRPAYDVAAGKTPDEGDGHAEPPFPRFAASFHKLLQHDPATGQLTDGGTQSYERLLDGLNVAAPSSDFNHDAFNQIVLADQSQRRRVLINPRSSKALTIKGGDSAALEAWRIISDAGIIGAYASQDDLLRDLSVRSATSAAEIVEVYAMAMMREHLFKSEYTTAYWDVRRALDALNAFGDDFRGPKERQSDGSYKVTARTLFRGNSPADLRGDYLSKFLLLQRPPLFASGCAPGVANLTNADIFFFDFAEHLTVPPPNPDREFGLTWGDYIELQNGRIPDQYRVGDFFTPKVVVRNGRHLGSLVHVDGFYEEFVWATDLLTAGDYRRSAVSPYTKPPAGGTFRANNEGDGLTLGVPDAVSLVGAVAIEAGRTAWAQKWIVARKARPETMAALIHKRRTGGTEADYGPLDARLLEETGAVANLLNRVKQENRRRGGNSAASTFLLGQMFPEGSPAHPAWVSGHATVAGACVTVIKAIFEDRSPLLEQTIPPRPFVDENGIPLTVGGELDKLASNVALGRNFGGVHYRSDGEHGILIGEEVAIRFLQDHLRTYRERFRCDQATVTGTDPCFELTKRNGVRVKITATDVTAMPGAAAITSFADAMRFDAAIDSATETVIDSVADQSTL